MQLALGASELGQKLFGTKSPAFPPVTLTLVISNVVVPVLVRVTFFVTWLPTSPIMNAAALQATGGNQPHNNMPPFLTIYFIIAMQGVYPSRS
jgi:microcystin-dependent protein